MFLTIKGERYMDIVNTTLNPQFDSDRPSDQIWEGGLDLKKVQAGDQIEIVFSEGKDGPMEPLVIDIEKPQSEESSLRGMADGGPEGIEVPVEVLVKGSSFGSTQGTMIISGKLEAGLFPEILVRDTSRAENFKEDIKKASKDEEDFQEKMMLLKEYLNWRFMESGRVEHIILRKPELVTKSSVFHKQKI